MELLVTFICVTFLVISVGNLLKLKGKYIAAATIIIDIAAIVVIALTVDLTPIVHYMTDMIRHLFESLMEGLK